MNTPLTSPSRLATHDARDAAGGAVALCAADEAVFYRGRLPVWCLGGCDLLSMYSPNGTGVDCAKARHSALPRDRGSEGFLIATARVEKSEQAVAQNSTGPPNEAAGRKLPSAGNCVSKEKETQMLDTSSQANFKPTAEIDDLDVLAKAIREHLQASANAAQNYLDHTLDVGDALIRAKAQVKHGEWLPWLKLCDLNEDKAERYMKLARHRAELNSAGVRNLSLSAALKLIAKKKPVDGPKAKKSRPLTHFDPLMWWSSASPEDRSRFIDGVGLKPLLAAIPPSWRLEAKQAVEPVPPGVSAQFRAALTAPSARAAFNYLTPVRRALAAYPIHDVEICLKNQNHGFGRAA